MAKYPPKFIDGDHDPVPSWRNQMTKAEVFFRSAQCGDCGYNADENYFRAHPGYAEPSYLRCSDRIACDRRQGKKRRAIVI